MKLIKYGFASKLIDNDFMYLLFIESLLNHADPNCEATLNKFNTYIKVSITPSQEDFRKHIIKNLLDAHHLFKTKIIFSKSLAIEKRINYMIEL